MNSKAPARMVVVKKEEKESRLHDLIRSALAAARSSGGTFELRVLALSLSSPVAAAVRALSSELRLAGVEARVMLVKSPSSGEGVLVDCHALRQLTDTRCHDAHELLVLGSETAWIGDSLRRDPVGRDSFELHAPNDIATALSVAQSFDRIWRLAVPASPRELDTALDLVAKLAALGSEPETMRALTRH